MKIYHFFLMVFATMILVQCQPGNTNTETTDVDTTMVIEETPEPSVPAAGSEECYRFVSKRDTYEMSFVRTGDAVKGRMIYKNFEKDSSQGEITGDWSGNILNVWYTFQSEGMTSVAQHMFMKSGDDLIEGHGDLDMRGDTSVFKDPANVAYKDMIFKSIDCAQTLKGLH